MKNLQNKWFKALTDGLSLNKNEFQIRQSVNPIIKDTTELWEKQNIVPPNFLTYNSSMHPGEKFSDEYGAIITQFVYPEVSLKEEIGDEVFQKWKAFLQTQVPTPSDTKLPTVFKQWAIRVAPAVANIGPALARMVLINRAPKAFKTSRS
jgi:hypothetical protein